MKGAVVVHNPEKNYGVDDMGDWWGVWGQGDLCEKGNFRRGAVTVTSLAAENVKKRVVELEYLKLETLDTKDRIPNANWPRLRQKVVPWCLVQLQ